MKFFIIMCLSIVLAGLPSGDVAAATITPTDIADVAYTLDGDAYINLTDAIFDNAFQNRTGAFWYNTSDATVTQMIYEEGGRINGVNVFIQDSRIGVGTWENESGAWLTTPTTSNSWHYVAYTYDGDNNVFSLYHDGQLAGETTLISGALPSHSGANAIGGVNGWTRLGNGNSGRVNQPLYFTGGILQADFQDTALSLTEIEQRYAAAPVPIPASFYLMAAGLFSLGLLRSCRAHVFCISGN